MEMIKDDKRVERIKEYMKKYNLSQIDMMKMLDIQQASLSKYLNGKMPVGEVLLYRLVCRCNINPMWLEHGSGEMLLDDKGVAVCEQSEDVKTLYDTINNLNEMIAMQRVKIKQYQDALKNYKGGVVHFVEQL